MNLRLHCPGAVLCVFLATPALCLAGEFEQAIEKAGTAIDAASAVNYEWRDSRKLLDDAIKAEKAGDHETAMKLAEKARLQGLIAATQAVKEKKSGPAR